MGWQLTEVFWYIESNPYRPRYWCYLWCYLFNICCLDKVCIRWVLWYYHYYMILHYLDNHHHVSIYMKGVYILKLIFICKQSSFYRYNSNVKNWLLLIYYKKVARTICMDMDIDISFIKIACSNNHWSIISILINRSYLFLLSWAVGQWW